MSLESEFEKEYIYPYAGAFDGAPIFDSQGIHTQNKSDLKKIVSSLDALDFEIIRFSEFILRKKQSLGATSIGNQ